MESTILKATGPSALRSGYLEMASGFAFGKDQRPSRILERLHPGLRPAKGLAYSPAPIRDERRTHADMASACRHGNCAGMASRCHSLEPSLLTQENN